MTSIRKIIAAPPVATPLPGSVVLFLPCSPPTATHHAKIIAQGRMIDAPALRAAKTLLASMCKVNRAAPLAPPVEAFITFVFAPGTRQKDSDAGLLRVEKPDTDNACKLVLDTVARAGWLADDKHVAVLHAAKLAVQPSTHPPGIVIELRTVTSALPTLRHQFRDARSPAAYYRPLAAAEIEAALPF